MIDLHNHILPGVDDGAADLEESLEIARQFVSEGVTRILATPHLDPENGRGIHGPRVRELTMNVQSALDDEGIPLDVTPGQELYLTPGAPDLLRQGAAICLGDCHAVLVELSLTASTRPLFLEDVLFQLELGGHKPILAHPERYAFVQRDPAALDALVDGGLMLQLTAPALLGHYGATVRRTAERLLRHCSYALAASDRHHPGPERSLAALHERISKLTDADTATLLLQINPAHVLAGETVVAPSGTHATQPSLFAKLFGAT